MESLKTENSRTISQCLFTNSAGNREIRHHVCGYRFFQRHIFLSFENKISLINMFGAFDPGGLISCNDIKIYTIAEWQA